MKKFKEFQITAVELLSKNVVPISDSQLSQLKHYLSVDFTCGLLVPIVNFRGSKMKYYIGSCIHSDIYTKRCFIRKNYFYCLGWAVWNKYMIVLAKLKSGVVIILGQHLPCKAFIFRFLKFFEWMTLIYWRLQLWGERQCVDFRPN